MQRDRQRTWREICKVNDIELIYHYVECQNLVQGSFRDGATDAKKYSVAEDFFQCEREGTQYNMLLGKNICHSLHIELQEINFRYLIIALDPHYCH